MISKDDLSNVYTLFLCIERNIYRNSHIQDKSLKHLHHLNDFPQFSFRSCKFKVQRCKEGTARVVVWMMGVLHSYTMEASFGGASEGPRAGTHYNIQDLISMGRQFCETLVEYFDPQPIKVIAVCCCWSSLLVECVVCGIML